MNKVYHIAGTIARTILYLFRNSEITKLINQIENILFIWYNP